MAKKVNNYQSRIKDMTRKMMGLVSELSMEQVLCVHVLSKNEGVAIPETIVL